MCTLWQAAGSSIISAAIQNSLSAFGHSAIKTVQDEAVKLKWLSSEKLCLSVC